MQSLINHNTENICELDAAKKFHKKWSLAIKVSTIMGYVGIIIGYIVTGFLKNKRLFDEDPELIKPKEVLDVDSVLFIIYLFFFVSLTAALVIFKVLERKY